MSKVTQLVDGKALLKPILCEASRGQAWQGRRSPCKHTMQAGYAKAPLTGCSERRANIHLPPQAGMTREGFLEEPHHVCPGLLKLKGGSESHHPGWMSTSLGPGAMQPRGVAGENPRSQSHSPARGQSPPHSWGSSSHLAGETGQVSELPATKSALIDP